MTYDTYVLVLCSIVYLLLTTLSVFIVGVVAKMSIRMIRCGAEDKQLVKEFIKSRKRRRKRGVLDVLVTVVFVVVFAAAFGFSLYVNINKDTYFDHMPTLKVVNSASMAKKHEKNTYLTENNLNDQFQTFDVVLVYKAPAEAELKLYDIVVYEIDNKDVIHRIVDIEEPNEEHPNERYFRLQGDNVSRPDSEAVKYSQIRAIYRGERVPFVGSFITFMQSPAGWMCMILLVVASFGVPLVEKKIEKVRKARFAVVHNAIMRANPQLLLSRMKKGRVRVKTVRVQKQSQAQRQKQVQKQQKVRSQGVPVQPQNVGVPMQEMPSLPQAVQVQTVQVFPQPPKMPTNTTKSEK